MNMINKLILFLFLQTLIIFGQETSTLTGHISNGKTGKWLNDIKVSVIGTDFSTKTDSMGNFEIKGIQVGNYTILINSFTEKSVTIKTYEKTHTYILLYPEEFYPQNFNNLRVDIKTDKKTYHIGEEIIFFMTFINESYNEIGVLDFSCYPGSNFYFKLSNSKPLKDLTKFSHTIKMGVVAGELKSINSKDSISLTKTALIDTNEQIVFDNPHSSEVTTCSVVFEAVKNELIVVKYLYNIPEWYKNAIFNKDNSKINKNKMWIGEVMSNEVSFKILND
ncbi:MAG: carboxypeptidase-like regulatory domain-containing protein [Melioribacteraceae bacterium]|nr:carboxypeptidase-like regulatory domain-containing protein [Melioribacteraceae bacterium]